MENLTSEEQQTFQTLLKKIFIKKEEQVEKPIDINKLLCQIDSECAMDLENCKKFKLPDNVKIYIEEPNRPVKKYSFFTEEHYYTFKQFDDWEKLFTPLWQTPGFYILDKKYQHFLMYVEKGNFIEASKQLYNLYMLPEEGKWRSYTEKCKHLFKFYIESQ